MFEAIIFGFTVFVVGYVGLMRLMARRGDVLYGEFILSRTRVPSGAAPSLVSAVIARLLNGVRSFAGR